MEREIKSLISKLNQGKIGVFDIPEDYQDNFEIIKTERKLRQRIVTKSGYDIISDKFFVEEQAKRAEEWYDLPAVLFDEFASYCGYLEGNIHDNACYYQLDPSKLPNNVDIERIFKKCSLIQTTINNYTLLPTEEEQAQYDEVEKQKALIKKWIEKFNACLTYEEFIKVLGNYRKSPLAIDISFFFWNYIFADIYDEDRFLTVMKYMSSGAYPENEISRALCFIYKPDKVVENYKYELGVYNTRRKHIREMERVAKEVKAEKYDLRRRKFFDKKTHYFCVETVAFAKGCKYPVLSYKEYFETIEQFIDKLKGDLRGCDLSGVQGANYDFTSCVVNEFSRLPINETESYKYILHKGYDSKGFYVQQKWENADGQTIKKYNHRFKYFFDFVGFLKGDLSNADLVMCDGLQNLNDTHGLIFNNALIPSPICEKLKIKYDVLTLKAPQETSFATAEANERESALQVRHVTELHIQEASDSLSPTPITPDPNDERIFYISDIHFHHYLRNKGTENAADQIRAVRQVAQMIVDESGYHRFVLIAGDTSLDSHVFELFIEELYRIKGSDKVIIFTIGNHDIWSYPDSSYDEIVCSFRNILYEHGMYLLQNDVLYCDEKEHIHHISEKELAEKDVCSLREKARTSRLIFFGGTGFAGYNAIDNASAGLYRNNNTIGYDRVFEMAETKKIDSLYKKICAAFNDKNVVVVTHMQLSDWHQHEQKRHRQDTTLDDQEKANRFSQQSPADIGTYDLYKPGFVYVNGHTHRNFFYDDGAIRIYADNQFGYNAHSPAREPHLKSFDIRKTYDFFADYSDGIYQITADEYKSFYRGKNIRIDFNRDVNILYMLKKNGYYCFIYKSRQKGLCIMNGGALKQIDHADIDYIYDKMDTVVSLIKEPLDQYNNLQKKIAQEIRALGGIGSIHGCIIDIDFYNHIYVNPIDGKITGYWASDIVNKVIYPTVPELLKARCPQLFESYKHLIRGNEQSAVPMLCREGGNQLVARPELYLDTDIYKASRQIKKMQKINANILTTWPDELPDRATIVSSSKMLNTGCSST